MTITQALRRSVLTLLAILAAAPAARGQEIAGSFDQLRVLVKPGDTITVTDDTGLVTRGKLSQLSPASLALVVDGNTKVLSAQNISTIQQRRSDPLSNGAKWGLGVGAALGLTVGLAMESVYDEDTHGAIAASAALTYGALGAGIGAGIDAMHSSMQVIYARPRTTARRVTVTPMMGKRSGIAVAVGF